MEGEVPADAGGRFQKAVDRGSGIVDGCDHFGFAYPVIRVVVRQVALPCCIANVRPNCRTPAGNEDGMFSHRVLACLCSGARYTRRHIGRLPTVPARPAKRSAQVRARQWNKA